MWDWNCISLCWDWCLFADCTDLRQKKRDSFFADSFFVLFLICRFIPQILVYEFPQSHTVQEPDIYPAILEHLDAADTLAIWKFIQVLFCMKCPIQRRKHITAPIAASERFCFIMRNPIQNDIASFGKLPTRPIIMPIVSAITFAEIIC